MRIHPPRVLRLLRRQNISIMPHELGQRLQVRHCHRPRFRHRGLRRQLIPTCFSIPTLPPLPLPRQQRSTGAWCGCSAPSPIRTCLLPDTRAFSSEPLPTPRRRAMPSPSAPSWNSACSGWTKTARSRTFRDQATYMDVAPEGRCENVRRKICLTLERMAFSRNPPTTRKASAGNRVDFRHSDPPCPPRTTPLPSSPSSKTIAAERAVARTFPQTSGGTPRRISHHYVRSGGAESAHTPGDGRDSGQDHGHDPIPQPPPGSPTAAWAHTKRRSTFRGRATTAPSSFAFLPPPASTGASSCAAPTAPPTHILPLRCSSGRDFPESRTTLLSRKPATSISTRRIPEM